MPSAFVPVKEGTGVRSLDAHGVGVTAYTVYVGLSRLKYEVWPYTASDLEAGLLPLTKDSILYGSPTQVHTALKQIGAVHPRFDVFPYALRRYMDREPQDVKLITLRSEAQKPEWRPCWVQPNSYHPVFKGTAIKEYADLISYDSLPDDLALCRLPLIEWISRWRLFIFDKEVVYTQYISGSPLALPNPVFLKKLVATAKNNMAQVAYALDVGVAHFAERPEEVRNPTCFIEAHEIYSLDPGMLGPKLFAKMLRARWTQMVEAKF